MERRHPQRNGTRGRHPDRLGPLRDGLSALTDEAADRATVLVDRVRAGGHRLLNGRKLRAASELSHVTAAVRRAADELYDHDSALAGYVDTSAEYLSLAAQYLESRELDELVDDARDVAHRRPALFLGGMLVAGLAVGRFLRAATESPPPPPSAPPRAARRAGGARNHR